MQVRSSAPAPAGPFDPLWVSVADQLRWRIVQGEVAPGQALSENQLASEFGVSRTPVREALRILMEEGLVEMLAGRRLRVALPDPVDVREVYETRWLLESEAVRRLAADPAAAQATCAQLQAACGEGDTALRHQDRQGLARANERYHEALVLALGNRRLTALSRTLYNLIALYRNQTLQSERWAAAGNVDHLALLEHIRAGRTDEALALLRSHLDEAQAVLAERLAASGGQSR